MCLFDVVVWFVGWCGILVSWILCLYVWMGCVWEFVLCFVAYGFWKIFGLLGCGDVLRRGLEVELVSWSLVCYDVVGVCGCIFCGFLCHF